MAHWRGRIDGPPARQAHGRPGVTLTAPVQGRIPALGLHRRPAVRKPQLGPAVAAVDHEGSPVGIGDEVVAKGVGLKPDAVRRTLIVEGEAPTPVADPDQATVEPGCSAPPRLNRA